VIVVFMLVNAAVIFLMDRVVLLVLNLVTSLLAG